MKRASIMALLFLWVTFLLAADNDQDFILVEARKGEVTVEKTAFSNLSGTMVFGIWVFKIEGGKKSAFNFNEIELLLEEGIKKPTKYFIAHGFEGTAIKSAKEGTYFDYFKISPNPQTPENENPSEKMQWIVLESNSGALEVKSITDISLWILVVAPGINLKDVKKFTLKDFEAK